MSTVFDIVLASSLIVLAWQALRSTDLFKAVVLFIAFGLLLSLVWVRLNAPDIALAEAAIGAGLTGALLLAALARLRQTQSDADATAANAGPLARLVLLAALPASAVVLGYAIWSLPTESAGLSAAVDARMAISGVEHPVTAVLLNFRGYDTLLEVLVLLLALLGVWSLRAAAPPPDTPPGTVLDTLARVLTPLLLLVALYLLWSGAHAPGGAFQAGAVLAAACVLLVLAGWRLPTHWSGRPLRLLLVLGPAVFLLTAVGAFLLTGNFLQFPPSAAGSLILLIEATATISIALTLAALFVGTSPDRNDS